jgi:hypothetical protein
MTTGPEPPPTRREGIRVLLEQGGVPRVPTEPSPAGASPPFAHVACGGRRLAGSRLMSDAARVAPRGQSTAVPGSASRPIRPPVGHPAGIRYPTTCGVD